MVACVGAAPEEVEAESCATTQSMQSGGTPAGRKTEQEAEAAEHIQGLTEKRGLADQPESHVPAWLIADNVDVVATADGQVGWTDRIDTGNHRPISQLALHLVVHNE